MGDFILAIDQGTTSTRAILLNRELHIVGKVSRELRQIYPKPGWVEHNPDEIWDTVVRTIEELIATTRINPSDIAAIGITNQRETTIMWEKQDSSPVFNAIVWQCRRSAGICNKLRSKGLEKVIKKRTGLVIDPYFSGTKMMWLLDNVQGLRRKSVKGEIAFGTVDSWLLWKLTGGACHFTDVSNASRTMLMNLKTLDWDEAILDEMDIPPAILPEIKPTSGVLGYTSGIRFLPDGIPVASMVGDQQAALFGQCCFEKATSKCTYGTGAFLLMNTGGEIKYSKHNLLSSVGWKIGKKTVYVLEGSAFIAGAAVQWLRDGLGIISSTSEFEKLLSEVRDPAGVMFVPAFSGLGAPYWDSSAKGVLCGLTRGTTRAHIARATMEGIAMQIYDLFTTMEEDANKKIKIMKVDGGASLNNYLMQFQSDMLDVEIVRPNIVETTAVGAGMLAGLAVGIWHNMDELRQIWKQDRAFYPQMPMSQRRNMIKRWRDTVKKSRCE
ncbi:MAG TPA: glycerol kinase GlpK [bacterium]